MVFSQKIYNGISSGELDIQHFFKKYEEYIKVLKDLGGKN